MGARRSVKKKARKLFWVKKILWFHVLVDKQGKLIKDFACSGCVRDYTYTESD